MDHAEVQPFGLVAQTQRPSFEDLIDRSFEDKFEILSTGFVPAPTNRRVAALFGLASTEPLFCVRALRSSAERPFAYVTVTGHALRPYVHEGVPLILQMERHCGLPAFEARQVAFAVAAGRHAPAGGAQGRARAGARAQVPHARRCAAGAHADLMSLRSVPAGGGVLAPRARQARRDTQHTST